MRELWGTLSIRKRNTTGQTGKPLCLHKEKAEDHSEEQQAYRQLWLRVGGKHKAQNYYRAASQAMKKKKVETENTRSVTATQSESQTLVLQKIVEFRHNGDGMLLKNEP